MAVNKDSDNAKSISIAEWQEIFGNIDNDEEFDRNTWDQMNCHLCQNYKKVQRMKAQKVRCRRL